MDMRKRKHKLYFPNMRRFVSISRHCMKRMKQRANLNTREKRKSFIKKASMESLSITDIPKADIFRDFKQFLLRIAKKRNSSPANFCRLFIFRDYILVISDTDAVIVTILNIEDPYKGFYNKIKTYKAETDEFYSGEHSINETLKEVN